ncbi:CynX/NimT family MFS transporter [Virgibacillus kekensis]|uniref:CynX/NimT family MFS transporter n=1 Tax=Virgibacillus kekensis TaxID=202261 RepID=A0ABV9DHG3_9BACI
MTADENAKQMRRFLLIAGIVLVAFNLRPAITSVGPLMGIIRDDLALSNWSVGILTSLPLIAFAVMSPLAPRLGNRFTYERTMIAGLILLLFGIAVRSIPVLALLFVGTLFVGLGIAICNVLLPGVVKDKFPAKVALMTSVYSTAMGIFAATASGVSIPLARGVDLGWELGLAVWTAPTVIAIIVWIILARKEKTEGDVELKYVSVSDNRMWMSPLAWQVACFMGLQSFLFYVTVSWLPEILHGNGMTMATAGWMLSFTQFVGLPSSFFAPIIAGRFKSQSGTVFVLALFAIGGYSGLLFGSSFGVMVLSTVLIGIAMSGLFALSLTMLGLRARNARQSGELSGMAQSIGYLLAAVGPMFIGFLYDLTHAWTVPLLTIIGVALLVMTFGMLAGRDRYVLD